MIIKCNEISQNIEYLLNTFKTCKSLKSEDMQKLVQLIAAVNTCANGGPDYNILNTDIYEPSENEKVVYLKNSFHSVSIMILNGTIIKDDVTFPTGSVLNYEFTTLNQTPIVFTVVAGSEVVVEYLTEK